MEAFSPITDSIDRMALTTNSVEPNTVREEDRGGDTYYVVKDVPFLRAMELVGGYVPDDHVAASAQDWGGVPLGVNHPRDNDGNVVSYSSSIGEQITVGEALDPGRNPDGSVSADLAVNVERAHELGGEALDIVDALENGDPLEVSSQYYADTLPPGVYDGQYRDTVEGNLRPDGIALLPNKRGQCSIADGCGAAPQPIANRAHRDPRFAELAADIVERSAKYDDVDTVLEDFPTEKSLRTKHRSLPVDVFSPMVDVVANDADGAADTADGVTAGVFE